MPRRLHLIFIVLTCAFALFSNPGLAERRSQKARGAKLEKIIHIPEAFRGRNIRFGDLNGDNKVDLVVAQRDDAELSHFAVLNLEGEVLWTWGTPNPRNFKSSADIPLQVFDWNADGRDDIIFVSGSKLMILDGGTGKTLHSIPHDPALNDAILIGNFFEAGKPALLVKSRYTSFVVYDHELRQRYRAVERTGHFPMAYDFDSDGVHELLVGYSLYRFQANDLQTQHNESARLWLQSRLTKHNDAVDIEDMDGDGKAEIAIAASRYAYILDEEGNILRVQRMRHAQHASIGSFRWSRPDIKQAAFLARSDFGKITVVGKNGRPIWRSKKFGKYAALSTVDGWTGKRGQSALFVFRADKDHPALYKSRGKKIASFPFPPALSRRGKYRRHFAQHFDFLGDCREEILIYNEDAVFIYSNPKPLQGDCEVDESLPNPRVYNASFYGGFQ